MSDETESAQNPTDPLPEQPAAEDAAPSEQAPEVDPAQPASGDGQADGEADELAAAALASAQAAIDALNAESDQAAEPAASQVPEPEEPGPAVVSESDTNQAQLSPMSMPDLAMGAVAAVPKGMDMLSDVNVDVTIELGRTRMLVEDVLRLAEGAVVELDKLAGDPVDIYVNKRLVARGEVLVLNDNFCIRVNDILDADLVEQERN